MKIKELIEKGVIQINEFGSEGTILHFNDGTRYHAEDLDYDWNFDTYWDELDEYKGYYQLGFIDGNQDEMLVEVEDFIPIGCDRIIYLTDI